MNEKTNTFPRSERIEFLRYCLGKQDVKGLKILDYGGNHGNLIKDGILDSSIAPKDYTCVDVDFSVLEESRKEIPDATWIYYNRYNQLYNPQGEKFIPLPFEDNTFDVAFSYSIHTHCSYEDFVFDLKELKRVAKTVITSYIDPEMGEFIKMKRTFDYGENELHPDWYKMNEIESYKYFIDGDVVTSNEIPNNCDFLITVYNTNWLLDRHPEITRIVSCQEMKTPMNSYTQPCIIIDEEEMCE